MKVGDGKITPNGRVRQPVHPKDRAEDDPERALRAGEQLVEGRAGGGPRT